MTDPFYKGPFSYQGLPKETKEKLSQIPDYPLDYNIFIYRGIKDIRGEMKDQLKEIRLEMANGFKNDGNKEAIDLNDDVDSSADKQSIIHEGIIEREDGSFDLELTVISEFQDRLLGLLILERHRRDIELLNELIQQDPQSASKKIKLIDLVDPYKYDIKSIFYKSLVNNYTKQYKETFMKFAIFQNIEFEFERILDEPNDELQDLNNDGDLIDLFHENEDILNFNDTYKVSAPSGDDGEEEHERLIEEMFENSKIIQVLMPLAAQSLFLGKK